MLSAPPGGAYPEGGLAGLVEVGLVSECWAEISKHHKISVGIAVGIGLILYS
mgnify:CR=1 FL=1